MPKGTDPDLLLDLIAQQVQARRDGVARGRRIALEPTIPERSVSFP